MNGLPTLKRLRLERGLSRRALAGQLDPPVSAQTIFNWETGDRRPNTDDLRRLAAALDVHPGALLDEQGACPPGTGDAA